VVGAQENLNGLRYLAASFLVIVIRVLALATINLSIKFELSVSIHYEDMKGNSNVKNSKWGGLG